MDATGAVAFAASGADMATMSIDHGFGTPATGFSITNVKNAVIQYSPRIVPSNDSTDNNTVRIWLAFTTLSTGDPTADFYVYY